ncbi:MAG TPA: tetratricopeptide repeat protein, partial [Archangium sp.]
MNSVLALSLQAQALASLGDVESARVYIDKVFAVSPTHPRTKILLGTMLAASSETVAEGKAILLDLSEGEAAKMASPTQRADAYLARADVAISAREYPEALGLVSTAVALVPNNRAFRIRAIDFAIRLRDYNVAREHAKQLLTMNAEDPAGVIGLARAKLGTKETLGAYSDLQVALKKHPDDADLNFWFGIAAKEMGKVQEAREQFERAQKLDPHAAAPVVENVLDAVEHGKLTNALKIADAAMTQVNASERHRVRAAKAYAFARRRQFKEASEEYLKALGENPRDSDARARYVETLIAMKQLDDADKQAAEAMLMDSKNPAVLIASGAVSQARGNEKIALDRFEEAMQLAPTAWEPYARAAVAAARLKDVQRARGLAETAGQLRPGNPDVIAAQAQVTVLQDPKQAATLMAQAVEAAPEDPTMQYLLGTVHQSMGAALEAIDALKRAVGLAPDYADAWFALGKVYRELGRTEDAKRAFAEVSRIDEHRADAWVETANILGAAGDDVGALAAYERAQTAEPQNPNSICAMGETLVERMGEDPKNVRRGLEMLERCVKLSPEHPT